MFFTNQRSSDLLSQLYKRQSQHPSQYTRDPFHPRRRKLRQHLSSHRQDNLLEINQPLSLWRRNLSLLWSLNQQQKHKKRNLKLQKLTRRLTELLLNPRFLLKFKLLNQLKSRNKTRSNPLHNLSLFRAVLLLWDREDLLPNLKKTSAWRVQVNPRARALSNSSTHSQLLELSLL